MGMTTGHDADGAMNALRNKAAAMGANAVKIINVDSDSEATTAIEEALTSAQNFHTAREEYFFEVFGYRDRRAVDRVAERINLGL